MPPHTRETPANTDEALSAPDDAALLARLKAGQDAAFEELVRTYGPRLLVIARRYFPQEADANDALQDAFLSAFKGLPRFEGASRLGTWLHRITVNACLMKLRSRRRRPETSIDELLPEFLPDGHRRNPGGPWKPIEQSGIERTEVRSLVRSMIDQLPDQYRDVLLLRDVENLDTEEAAEVLGISPNAVKTRLHRARQALRTLLDPHFSERAS